MVISVYFDFELFMSLVSSRQSSFDISCSLYGFMAKLRRNSLNCCLQDELANTGKKFSKTELLIWAKSRFYFAGSSFCLDI